MGRMTIPHDRREIAAVVAVAVLGLAVGLTFFLMLVRAFAGD
jgi:hypothetical protein